MVRALFLIFLQSRSLVSGHVCFRTPPEGSEPADPDINRSIKKQTRAIVFFPQQSDKWREDAEPKGSAEWPQIQKWSLLMDGDVHPTSPLTRPPLHPPSFIFVTSRFVPCAATGLLFVKVTDIGLVPRCVMFPKKGFISSHWMLFFKLQSGFEFDWILHWMYFCQFLFFSPPKRVSRFSVCHEKRFLLNIFYVSGAGSFSKTSKILGLFE